MTLLARIARLERRTTKAEDPARWAHTVRMWRVFPDLTHPDDVTDEDRALYRWLFGEDWPVREPRPGERRRGAAQG